MIQWLSVFAAQFAFVGLRAFQQRNVAFDNYALILPTSCCIAVVESYVIAKIAMTGWGWSLVSAMALGAALGCLLAMQLHKYWTHNVQK